METSLKSVEQVVDAFHNQEQMIDEIYMEINNLTTNVVTKFNNFYKKIDFYEQEI
jgi:hypothetical protein